MTTYKIKDFGKDKPFQTLDEMVKALLSSYTGRSVSICKVRANGSTTSLSFIDIASDGVITQSNGSLFTFSEWDKP